MFTPHVDKADRQRKRDVPAKHSYAYKAGNFPLFFRVAVLSPTLNVGDDAAVNFPPFIGFTHFPAKSHGKKRPLKVGLFSHLDDDTVQKSAKNTDSKFCFYRNCFL